MDDSVGIAIRREPFFTFDYKMVLFTPPRAGFETTIAAMVTRAPRTTLTRMGTTEHQRTPKGTKPLRTRAGSRSTTRRTALTRATRVRTGLISRTKTSQRGLKQRRSRTPTPSRRSTKPSAMRRVSRYGNRYEYQQ